MSEMRLQIQPTVISLFAGCGGSSLGYHMAGYRELLAVEWDKNQALIFKLNFPQVPLWFGDIKKLTGTEIRQITNLQIGELDVLDGSPPCQGFSMAKGKKSMINDCRNQLFFDYIRILRDLKPKVFIAENVPGMIHGKMRFLFNWIFQELQNSGYKVKSKILNAANYQVPQKRQRLIFIGLRNDIKKEITFPFIQKEKKYVKKLDQKPVIKFQESGWYDFIIKENSLCNTKTTINRFLWTRNLELGLKSYAYIGSFPETFKWTTFYKAKRAIGNSVPPLLMYHIANHVKNTLLT